MTVYCYIYDVSTRTVPLVWETSGSVVVDSSFIVTFMMYRQEQYHLFGKLLVSVVVDSSFIVICMMYRREQYHLFGKLVFLLSLIHR